MQEPEDTSNRALVAMAKPKNPNLISFKSSRHLSNTKYPYPYPYYYFYCYFISPSSPPSNPLFKSPPRKQPTTTCHVILLFFLLFLFVVLPILQQHPAAIEDDPAGQATAPLKAREMAGGNMTEEEREFWRQPDGMGYRPCIEFGLAYRRESARVVRERRRFVVAVVSGGLNQQRHQIVDAVVIARIIGAALVVPVLQPNVVWGDTSDFSEIFDVDHFKRTLRSDVRIVLSLPVTHQNRGASSIPFNASPLWIRTKFSRQLKKEGVLVLKGIDSKLSKDLPIDLQKLRCKVALHALRFAAPIRELGNKLAMRMWDGGPYVALHLRLEKDVWVRTGCLPGLGPEYDELVLKERRSHPEFLTGRSNLTLDRRRLAGLCPLNGLEVARLLRALGAPRSARVYWAGGDPLGGDRALQPLAAEFPNLIRKETLGSEAELAPFVNKSSALAAVDFIIAASSDVFMPSHGGNMGRAIQGYRTYAGHRKNIKPNKRALVQLLGEVGVSEAELRAAMKRAHRDAMGRPEAMGRKSDVIANPVPGCMCKRPRPFMSLLQHHPTLS